MLITPAIVVLLLTVSVREPCAKLTLLSVRLPVPAESPSCALPPSESTLVIVRAVELSEAKVPPLSENVPVPNALLLPARRTPALKVAPPPKVFAPERIIVPVPDLTSEPVFVIRPPNVCEPDSETVNTAAPATLTLPPVPPPPRSEPIVSFVLTRKVAPELLERLTAAVSAMAAPLVTSSTPALTVVVPV